MIGINLGYRLQLQWYGYAYEYSEEITINLTFM